jgi:tetratricopeptide (TPR) repeat protein
MKDEEGAARLAELPFLPPEDIIATEQNDEDDAEAMASPWDEPRPRARTSELGPEESDLERLYEAQGRWPELIEYLLEQAEESQPSGERARALGRVADLFDTRLGDPERAFVTIETMIEAGPDDGLCAQAERLATRLGRIEALVTKTLQVCKAREVGSTDIPLLVRLAGWARAQQRWSDALWAAEAALHVDPWHGEALGELAETNRTLQRWQALAVTLVRTIEALRTRGGAELGTPGAAADVALRLELAALWEEKLGDRRQAIDLCEQVLAVDGRNEVARARLRRLYGGEGQMDRLVALLEGILEDRLEDQSENREALPHPERWSLTMELAGAWQSLGRPDETCRALERLAFGEKPDAQASRDLAGRYKALGMWQAYARVCGHLATICEDAAERALHAVAAGVAFDEHLGRGAEAEAAYRTALEADPGRLSALRGLAALYLRRSAWRELAEVLVRLSERSPDAKERASALVEAAAIHRERLNDEASATELARWAHEIDGSSSAVAGELLEAAIKREDWKEVLTLGDRLLADPDPGAETSELKIREAMARAALALGEKSRALEHLNHAQERGCRRNELLLARVELLEEASRWTEVAGAAKVLLNEAAGVLAPAERRQLLCRLGRAALALEIPEAAMASFEQALAHDRDSREALEGLIEAYARRGDHRNANELRWRLFKTGSESERIAIARAIAAACRDHLNSSAEAAEALEIALRELPRSHELLHDLLDLLTQDKRWRDALKVLERLASREHGPLRAKYLDAAGKILHYELGRTEEAMGLFEAALDVDPTSAKTAERIEKILYEKQDARGLERSLRRALQRLERFGGEEVQDQVRARQVDLWSKLGELYRAYLQDPQAAIVAYEVVERLRPEDDNARASLGDLYELTGAFARAVACRRARLSGAATLEDLVRRARALQQTLARAGDGESALAITGVLSALGQAAAHEVQVFRSHVPPTWRPPVVALKPEAWVPHLYHEHEAVPISAVMAAISRAVLIARGRPAKQWGLGRRTGAMDLAARGRVESLVGHLAAVFGMTTPPIEFAAEGAADVVPVLAEGQPMPVLVVGPGWLAQPDDKILAHDVGRTLALMRSEHVLLWPQVMSLSELKAAMRAACKLGGLELPVPAAEVQLVAGYGHHLQSTLNAAELEQLAALVRRMGPTDIDAALPLWIGGVVRTAARAAALACGDLEVAAYRAEPATLATVALSRQAMLEDLLWWSSSESHLGLARLLRGG